MRVSLPVRRRPALLAKGKDVMTLSVPCSEFPWAAALDRARDVAGLKDENVAAIMQMSRVQYSQQKHGHGHLSMQRLSLLAEDREGFVMLRAFMAEWAAYHGLTDLELAGEWLRSAIHSYTRLRMAKAGIRPQGRIAKSA